MKSYCSGELCHIRLTDNDTESDSYHKPEICHCCSGILHSCVTALPNDCAPDSRPYRKPHRDPQCVGQPWSSTSKVRDPPKPPSLLPPVSLPTASKLEAVIIHMPGCALPSNLMVSVAATEPPDTMGRLVLPRLAWKPAGEAKLKSTLPVNPCRLVRLMLDLNL